MSTSGKPSYMRYSRVQAVLEKEAFFKDKLSPKDQAVFSATGTRMLFPIEVIAVTHAIHEKGQDAYTMKQDDVVRTALQVLKDGSVKRLAMQPMKEQEEPKPPAASPAPVVSKKPAPAPEVPKKKRGRPRKVQPPSSTPAPAPAPEPEGLTEAKPKGKVKVPVAAAPTPPEPETPSEDPEHVEVPRMPRRTDVPQSYCVYVSATSLLVSTDQLLDAYDRAPGKERRLKTITDLIREVQGLAVIQLPGAKKA